MGELDAFTGKLCTGYNELPDPVAGSFDPAKEFREVEERYGTIPTLPELIKVKDSERKHRRSGKQFYLQVRYHQK